jgi:hypothetical protein
LHTYPRFSKAVIAIAAQIMPLTASAAENCFCLGALEVYVKASDGGGWWGGNE